MSKNATIGLVVPHAEDKVPAEGHQMYPDQRFIPKGVGVRSLTPEGYAAAFDAIMPAAEHLVKQNVDAIMVIGTSLTFYRGPEAHDRLLEKLRTTTGLPVSDHEPGDPRRPQGGRRQTRRGHNRLHRRGEPAPEGAAGRGRLSRCCRSKPSTSSSSAARRA